MSGDRPANSSGDIHALYDALEGSVVLLQVCSCARGFGRKLLDDSAKTRSLVPSKFFT